MDLWVVAVAAGAGYLAKYWQNLSGESESSSRNSIPRQSESLNLLQQIGDQTCRFCRWSRRRLERESSEREGDISDGQFIDASSRGSDAKVLANRGNYENHTSLLPKFHGTESFQENSVGRNEEFDNSGDALTQFDTNRLPRSRPLRNRRSHEFYAKPLNSLESCLTAQMSRDRERQKDHLIGSSSLEKRLLLVSDGNGRVRREGSDSLGKWDDGKEHRLRTICGISLIENSNLLPEAHLSQQMGLVELPRKAEHICEKNGRLSSSNTMISGDQNHTRGSPNGMLLFFIGITIGILSAVVANKKEMDNLNELLKWSKNLARDLHEELEMKNMLTVKEIDGVYNQSQETTDCSSSNPELVASSSKQESAKPERKEPDDREVESHELMSKIEAELEAELERLELNIKASTLQRISDFVELDPDFEAEVIQGDFKVRLLLSQSDSDANGTSTDHTHTSNYAVSPRELTLRLHEVIESRLKARIKELKLALQNSQKKVHSLRWQLLLSQTNVALSTPGSPNFINEVHGMDQPLEINFSGESSDAYNEAYEEILRAADSDEETRDTVCGNSHIEQLILHYDKRFGNGQTKGCDDVIGTLEQTLSRIK